jgi:hypothetical protein
MLACPSARLSVCAYLSLGMDDIGTIGGARGWRCIAIGVAIDHRKQALGGAEEGVRAHGELRNQEWTLVRQQDSLDALERQVCMKHTRLCPARAHTDE